MQKKKNKNVLGVLCMCVTAEMFYSSKQMKKTNRKSAVVWLKLSYSRRRSNENRLISSA